MYGKLFKSMFTGSMYGMGATVIAVWAYVIANKDRKDGVIDLNPIMLAGVIGEPEKRIVEAIEMLCSPDPNSRSKEYEGRRLLREGQFQYKVVNWDKYNNIHNDDDRKEYNRMAKQAERDREKREKILEGNLAIGNPDIPKPPPKKKYGEFQKVSLSDEEYQKLLEQQGARRLAHGIEVLDDYLGTKKKDHYASHYAVMKRDSWVWDEVEKKGGGRAMSPSKAKVDPVRLAEMAQDRQNAAEG